MRKRFVFAAVCILALPLWFSPSPSKLTNGDPYSSVAFAGRTLAGNWCDCGATGCICDPGENPGGNSASPVTDRNESSDQGLSPIRAHSRSGFDFGTGTLILLLALFLWAKLRA